MNTPLSSLLQSLEKLDNWKQTLHTTNISKNFYPSMSSILLLLFKMYGHTFWKFQTKFPVPILDFDFLTMTESGSGGRGPIMVILYNSDDVDVDIDDLIPNIRIQTPNNVFTCTQRTSKSNWNCTCYIIVTSLFFTHIYLLLLLHICR